MTLMSKALAQKQAETAIDTCAGVPESWLAGMHAVGGTQERQENKAVKAYNDASSSMDDATQRILESGRKLADAAEKATRDAKSAIGRAKDTQAQLGDVLGRTNKMLGQDFEGRLCQLERMTAALSTLAELEKSGMLKNVIQAISK